MKVCGLLFLLFFTSCTLEPKYTKPQTGVNLKEIDETKDISQTNWQSFFNSPNIKNVIEIALKNNRDLKNAYLNMEIAKTTYDVKKADLLPSIGITSNVTRQQAPASFALFTPKSIYRANITMASYELDFFGRIRSLKKSAYESYLATEEAKNVMELSLVSDVANAYVQLRADKQILSIIKDALRDQSKKLELIQKRYKNGRGSIVDSLLAETELENMRIMKNTYEKAIEHDTNLLVLLMGGFDKSQIPDEKFEDLKFNEKVLDDMPSKVLLSRPDIKQAEHNLKAANANIGAARAAFFPSITMTGNYGYYSRDLGDLMSSDSWSIIPQINIPIFSAGKNKANLKAAKLQKEVLVNQYEKAIQNAFREVMDQLVDRKMNVDRLKSYKEVASLNERSYEILQKQYIDGRVDAVMVADSHLKLLTAKQSVIIQQRDLMVNFINLYKVFGGGSNIGKEQSSL